VKEIDVIRGLYESLNRPVEIKQIDLGLTSLLVIRGGLTRPVHTSESALALALIVSEPTVAASVTRLQSVEWVQKRSGKSRRVGNSYVVILDNLPVTEELKRTLISPMARTIAESYIKAMPTNAKGRPRRFTKAERQRIAFALQTFLDKFVDGDGKLLCDVINFALNHPKYAMRARKGPHMLRRPFKKLLKEFRDSQTAEAAKPRAASVCALQHLRVDSLEALRVLLNDPKTKLIEGDCVLSVQTGEVVEKRAVSVFSMGGRWVVLDSKTHRGVEFDGKAA
jgi:hypothetical protein